MGIIKVFVQRGCSKCPQAKLVGETLRGEGFTVMEFDVSTADGLAEAAFYSVQATPTIIVADSQENLIADFRGEVPSAQMVRELMGHMQASP
jgi:hypothetical protein